MPDSILTLRTHLAWAHDFSPDRSIAALTTASIERKWLNGFSLAAIFEGEFSDVTRSYAGKASSAINGER
jgi:hypothetical protein